MSALSPHERTIYEAATKQESQGRERNLREANETDRALSGQLMLLCTVFLPLSLVVVGGKDTQTLLSPLGKILLIAAYVAICVSIALGIKYYFSSVAFYEDWAAAQHRRYEKVRNALWNDEAMDLTELNDEAKDLKEVLDKKWLRRQVGSLLVGGVLILLVVVSLLYDFKLRF